MAYQKPDGTIEFSGSGCCCPPGPKRPGMHANASTNWYRINDGEWKGVARLCHDRILAGAAETCKEFEEAIDFSCIPL